MSGTMLRRLIAAVLILLLPALAAAAPLRPRAPLVKPARVVVDPRFDRSDVLHVRFRDDVAVRLRDGRPSDLGTGGLDAARAALDALAPATWARAHLVGEVRLDELRATAQRTLGRAVADLNNQYLLRLAPAQDANAVLAALNALDAVELARPARLPPPPPLPPNFQGSQVYENFAPAGVGAEPIWAVPGVTGAGIRVCDIEYNWNFDHQDLPPFSVLGGTPTDPFGSTNHGTAVLGQMASIDNGWGTTGICHGATFFVAGASVNNVWNPGAGITAALGTLEAGDVILIEQQTFGPNGGNYVPIEWEPDQYDAIVTAVGNGVIVVEAAGNGGEDLDAPIYSQGNFGHWPFLPENDSGAIIVGAGAAFGGQGSDVDRSRLGFSCHGTTVDLQGWGEGVWTTGYGGAWGGEGQDLWYTAGFGGTSSASPIVAGAVVLLQSAHELATGERLTPGEVRAFLRETGSPQQSGVFPATQNIGPRPDVVAALEYALGACDPVDDCNGNGIADACDLADATSADCNGNNVPDECDIAGGLDDDCDGNGAPDGCQADCNANGVADVCDIAAGDSDDDNGNGVPDECDPLANDVCGQATIVALGENDVETVGAHDEGFDEPCGGGPPVAIRSDVWYRLFNATCDGPMTVSVVGADFDARIAVYGVLCPSMPGQAIACADGPSLTFDAAPGQVYRFRVGSSDGGQGTATLVVECGDDDPCPADTNGDEVVDVTDLVNVILDWGTDGADHDTDIDGSGVVDVADLVELVVAWGAC